MRLLLCILLLLPSALSAATATSVTQRNVTWTFSASRTVGQYANGDWWVVGPVTITSITPASATTGLLGNGSAWWRSGAQLNAVPSSSGPQGFDNAMNDGVNGPTYNAGLNVDPGHTGASLVVSEGTVIKAISQTTRPFERASSQAYAQLTDMEYLTVVVSEPAASSFRPPPVGTDKTSQWTTNDLNFSILRSLPVLSGAPTKATAEGYFLRPWPSWIEGNRGRSIKPTSNMPNYGRDFGRRLGNGGLVLHSDVGDKTTLFIRLVQIGIDAHATIEGSVFFSGDGGINVGWKFPALLAGLALNDTNILYNVSGGISTSGSAPNANRLNFAFDRQTWYVLQSDVGRVLDVGHTLYTQDHVGLPEWGFQHWIAQRSDDSSWSASYRPTAFSGAFSTIFASLLTTGGSSAWGWPATTEYWDRYMDNHPNPVDQSFGVNRLTTWEGLMYDTYRSSVDVSDVTAPVISSISSGTPTGTTATITAALNESARTGIRYGTSAGVYTLSATNNTFTSSLSLPLASLTASTTYYYQLIATDSSENSSAWTTEASFATIAVDVTLPVATMVSPDVAATLIGPVLFEATVTDNVAVAGVSFYMGGALVGQGAAGALDSYSVTVDSRLYPNAATTVWAAATDTSGNIGYSATNSVTIANTDFIAWWPFNENTGTLATDVASGIAANLVGGATWTIGRTGSSVQLTETGQQVNVADPFVITGDKLTVMAWVLNTDSQNSFPRIVSVATSPGSPDRWFELTKYNTAQTYSFSARTVSGFAEPVGGTAVLGQWQHVAGVYDGTNAMLYVDAQLVATTALTGNLRATPPAMVIGQVGGGSTRGWLGAIDDVRVYSIALTEQNIADIWAANFDIPPDEVRNLRASTTSGSVRLQWDVPATGGDGVDNYSVYRGPDADNLVLLDDTVTALEYIDETVAFNTAYVYSVIAVNLIDAGPQSLLSVTSAPEAGERVNKHGRILPRSTLGGGLFLP